MPKKASKSRNNQRRRERRLSVRSELRREPDLQKIAGTVIALAIAQAEKEAQGADELRRRRGDRNAS